MMRNYLFCMVLTVVLMVLGGWTLAADLYVATNGSHGTATNWSTAYTNIQTALDVATNNDTIYLAGHTFLLTNQLNWTNCSDVNILGGYAATNDADKPGPYDAQRWPTVITRSGASNFRILAITNVTAGILERVTITGGYETNNKYGGGVYIVGSTGLLISGCVITNNTINPASGGGFGGGIGSLSSVVTLTNCLVKGNFVRGPLGVPGGGGIYTDGGMTLYDSIIANNEVNVGNFPRGGGIYGTCRLRNCLVVGNSASYQGGGLYGGPFTLENCTVAYNAPWPILPGSGCEGINGSGTVTNSIIWGHAADIVGTVTLGWSDSGNGVTNGVNGCISADPLFERGVYYLAPNSPGVDAGTNTAAFWGLTNYTTRVDGSNDSGRVDLGYHYQTGYDFSHGDFYVATNGNNTNSGTSWANAYRTVTKALSVARDGTRVHVGSGTYNTNGGESFPLTVANLTGVQILGEDRATTVINAAGSSNRVMTITNCNYMMVSEVTLTGGYETNNDYGGGIYLNNCGGIVLSGCVITNNTIDPAGNGAGGGICSLSSVVTVSNCLVSGNFTRGAGGMTPGGGIYMSVGMVTLRDSIIANNQIPVGGWRRGGGIYNGSGTCWLRNCLVYGNDTAAGDGGDGLHGAFTLENCTVAYNAPNTGYGINGSGTVTNSIVWGNGDDIAGTVTLGWSNIEDGDNNTTNGCIKLDPVFVDTNAANYRLSQGSPCINTGTNMEWMLNATDLDGKPRINSKTVDMGAYEVQLPPAGTMFMCR